MPASAARRSWASRNVAMNGDRPIDSGSTPQQQVQHRRVAGRDHLQHRPRARRPPWRTRCRAVRRSCRRSASRSCSSASGPCICVWLTRVSTSAPNGAWRLIVDSTAAAAPARRSIRVATTVVVPTSIETPNSRSVVSPGSTSTRRSPITVAVTVESSSSSIAAARRGRTLAACVTSSPSTDERVGDATEPAAGIVDRGRLQGEQVLHGVRLQQHEPPHAHRGGLGHRHRSRHVDHHVLGHLALAGQAPALVEPLGDVAVVGERRARRGPPAPGPCTCRTCHDRRTSTRSGCPPSAPR